MKFFKCDKLVYIAIRKNASSFYTNYFQLQLGWKEISLQEVDWENDIVFSHISDPMERHIKGISEAISQFQLIRDLFNDSKFCSILGHSVLDSHCVPICLTLGKHIEQIDWILLDSKVPSETLTNKFLLKYNIDNSLTYEPFKFRNSKSQTDSKVRSKIKTLIDLNQNNDTLNLLYEQDKILYSNVKSKFDKFISDSIVKYSSFILDPKDSKNAWSNITWDEISWLRNE